ncbi:MAG: hypothetical protein ABI051_03865 [Vicinamibacterales bacterium]
MPDWRVLVRQRLAAACLPPMDELGIVEELAQHLEDCYRELCAQGMPEGDALELSLQEVDGQELTSALRESRPRK